MSITDASAWDTINSIAAEARVLIRQDRTANLTSYYLELLVSHSNDEIVRSHLHQSLMHEYQRHGDFKAATEIALMAIADRPSHPMPVLGIVSQKLYAENDPAAALPFAIKAVVLADSIREFRRHARANLLRVASALGDTVLVEKCLVEIIGLELEPGEPDVAREADLLVHAKAAGVGLSILHRYRSFLGPVSLPITSELPSFRSNEEGDDADQ
jgi:hypothetical protein